MRAPHLKPGQTLVFFDGICGMCNEFIDFTLPRDTAGNLLFSPRQGEAFAALVKYYPPLAEVDSIVALNYRDGTPVIKVRSRAIFYILSRLPGLWKLTALTRIIPAAFMDFFYDRIAKNRYRIFGKFDACRLPTPEERSRFID